MRNPTLILVGLGCKAIGKEHCTAFLRHLTEKIGAHPCSMNGERLETPNPGTLYRAKTGFIAWSFWAEGMATIAHEEKEQIVTLYLHVAKRIEFMPVDTLFRWYFEPSELLNSIPVLSGPRG